MTPVAPRLAGVYALIDPAAHAEPLPYLEALLRGGIRLVQIRAKGGIAPALLRALVARIRAAGATAIVNDDVDLALEADGVHLGQEDLAGQDLQALRMRFGARAIGVSCGTPAEARALPPGLVDYVGAGPIFATSSKSDAGRPIGVNGVRAVVEATALPVAAIGGITLAALPRARETGAAMAAVISALAAAADPEATARAFVAAWVER
ncbi:MAG TPA: thiamine phosphate synthase [Candidatus Lustribacter sp.]